MNDLVKVALFDESDKYVIAFNLNTAEQSLVNPGFLTRLHLCSVLQFLLF